MVDPKLYSFFAAKEVCALELQPNLPKAAFIALSQRTLEIMTQGFPQYVYIMRGSPVETLQWIKCSRGSLPGYRGRSMGIVLNPRTETCTGDTWCRMGPRPTQQPSPTGCTPSEEETWQRMPSCPQCSSESLAKGDGGQLVSVHGAYISWLSFLGFSQVLHLLCAVQIQDWDPEL